MRDGSTFSAPTRWAPSSLLPESRNGPSSPRQVPATPKPSVPWSGGQSRWDSSVFGSSEDQARLDTVFAILFPGAERTSTRGNNVRDAMHISTAIRYGAFGFVTRDRKLLNKFQQIADRFQGFRVWPPEDAVAEAIDRIRAARELHRREPHRGALPAWPSDDDLPSPSLG